MEIERRAFVDSFSELRQKLVELGFEKEEEKEIVDRYFCREDVDSVEGVAMDEPGSYGLRTRKTPEMKELNCKVIENHGDHNAFIEHETHVSDIGETRQILEAVGFKQFVKIDKTREIYRHEDEQAEVNIEDIKNFPPVIELETIADENVEEKKQRQMELLDEIGIEEDDIIEKSITLLYIQENAFNR